MVPKSLRFWFTVHFLIDIIFAVPLILAPELTLSLLGWTRIDPLATRLVGAALMGIGLESLLGRKGNVDVFRAMLNLKIIWSISAVIGLGLSMVGDGPAMGWVFLFIFAAFFCLWTYYRLNLRVDENETAP